VFWFCAAAKTWEKQALLSARGFQAGGKAPRIHHKNGAEVRKKRPRGFKKRPRGCKKRPRGFKCAPLDPRYLFLPVGNFLCLMTSLFLFKWRVV
jgi:hypothetical protein